MMRLQITRSATEDLLNGHDFYELQQAGIGAYFLDSLYSDIDALALYAGIHPKPIGNLHCAMSRRFPFAIYYNLNSDVVTVMAVLDCRQNPASIVERLVGRR